MPVRFDAAADRLVRTTGVLNYNAAYTVCFRVRVTSDTNDYVLMFSINTNATSGDHDEEIGANLTGATATWYTWVGTTGAPNGVETTGGSVILSTWYDVAIVRNSTTLLTLYVDGTSTATNTRDVSARSSATRMEMGGWTTTDASRLDGRLAHIKIWDTNLTQAEIDQERGAILPRRLSNLWAFYPTWPGSTERARDYSGNARDWTEGGTLTDEQEPPVSWGAPSIFPPFTAAAVAGGQPMALRHTLDYRGFGRGIS